jgi:flagella basal body P-ring formation protein FlgA
MLRAGIILAALAGAMTLAVTGNLAGAAHAAPVSDLMRDAIEISIGDELTANARIEVSLETSAPQEADSIAALQTDPKSGRFRAALLGDKGEQSVVTGSYRVLVTLPVPVRKIAKGEIIAETDLREKDFLQTLVDESIINAARMAAGREARRNLLKDRPIAKSAIGLPFAVKRGDAVLIIAEGGLLTLTSKGKALEDGAPGDEIRVLNLVSKKNITGLVAENGNILVETTAE